MALEKILKNSSGVPTGEYERIAGGTLYAASPVGTIVPYGGESAPSGWHICDGSEVSKTTYSELYAVIGDAFGTASVSTNFCLPDLRESVPKGIGLTSKSNNHLDADGLQRGEFLEDRVQVHEHYIGDTSTPQHLGYSDREGQNAGIGNRTVDATIESDRKWVALQQSNVGIAKSGRYGATTEVKAVGVNYIIKAKMIALPADFVQSMGEFEKYSTDEVLTNKTWIDGKPIYRKVVKSSSSYTIPANAWTDITSHYTLPSIGTLVSAEIRHASNYSPWIAITRWTTSNKLETFMPNGAEISTSGSIVLEYTKN